MVSLYPAWRSMPAAWRSITCGGRQPHICTVRRLGPCVAGSGPCAARVAVLQPSMPPPTTSCNGRPRSTTLPFAPSLHYLHDAPLVHPSERPPSCACRRSRIPAGSRRQPSPAGRLAPINVGRPVEERWACRKAAAAAALQHQQHCGIAAKNAAASVTCSISISSIAVATGETMQQQHCSSSYNSAGAASMQQLSIINAAAAMKQQSSSGGDISSCINAAAAA